MHYCRWNQFHVPVAVRLPHDAAQHNSDQASLLHFSSTLEDIFSGPGVFHVGKKLALQACECCRRQGKKTVRYRPTTFR
jgi:hypothetical protein